MISNTLAEEKHKNCSAAKNIYQEMILVKHGF